MRARIVTGTVPGSVGTVDYTHPDISSWSTKGLAIVIVSGNSQTESEGGRVSIGIVDQDGNQRMSSTRLLQGRPTVSDCCNANHSASVARIVDDDPLPGTGTWAEAVFSSALTNGVRLNWSNVSGVSGRTFNVVVILVDGLTQCQVGSGSGATLSPTFEPDAVFAIGVNGSINGAGVLVNNDGHVSLGAAVDGSPITQAAIVTAWDTSQATTTAHGIARNDVYGLDFSPPATQTEQVLDDFTATGFTDTGAGGICWAALQNTGPERFAVALESLDGSTGAQRFTGLGISSQVVVGIINGNTSSNTIQGSTAALSTLCVFVTAGGSFTYSASLAQNEGDALGTAGDGNDSEAFSRYTSGSINMLDENGGTAFVATVNGLAGGLDLTVSTGFTGRMWLFGIGAVAVPVVPRRRRHRARRAQRTRRPIVIGGARVSAPPFPRWLKAVQRMRAQIRARLRWRPRLQTVEVFHGEPAEEAKGRIFSPGMIRGRIYGGGIPSPELEDPPPWPPFPPSWTTWTRDPTTATTALS